MKVLFKTVHFLTVEDIPLVKFQAFVDFIHDLGHEELDILKLSDTSYKSSYTATELLDCLSDVAEANLKAEMASSPVVTALADESINIVSHKRLAIYTQIISNRVPTEIQKHNSMIFP